MPASSASSANVVGRIEPSRWRWRWPLGSARRSLVGFAMASIVAHSATGVLDEVVETVVRRQAGSAVPAPPHVTPDRAVAVVGGARCGVPEVGVMQQDVATLAVQRQLTRYALEPGRHLLGTTEVRAREHTEKPVAG